MKTKILRSISLKTTLSIGAILLASASQAQWTTVDTPGFLPGGNLSQHLFFDAANTPYVSFSAMHGQVMKYTDSEWVSVGGGDITAGNAYESWSAIAPDGNIYFSYADGADTSKAAVLMYNGSSWTSIGSGLSTGGAGNTNIVVSSAGVPYLSFIDRATSPTMIYVKQYVGGSWVTLGDAPVDTLGALLPNLAIDDHDSLYIAYQDAAYTEGVIVKKFNGVNWTMLDTAFSAEPGDTDGYISLAIDHSGVPYVSYVAKETASQRVSVSKFNGTHWVTVGAANFSPDSASFCSLAIDHSNVPYVVFDDNTIGGATSVMKYNDTEWAYMGSPAFSSPAAVFTTIAIDENNNPYVAFIDEDNGGTTVMKYPVCTPSSKAVVTASDTLICKGKTSTLMASGDLKNAANWYWYTSSCAGTFVDTGATITVIPSDTTTYYVQGFGGCVRTTICNSFTVNVDSMAKPSISVTAGVLTSSIASGNQWYLNNALIPGATVNEDTAIGTGWYKVTATNSNGCSATSDSVFVNVADGILNVSKDMQVSVYPSPANDLINIDFTGKQSGWANATIYITDNLGRKVLSQNDLNQKNTLSIGSLSPGIYFINLISPDGGKVMKITKL